MKKLLVTQDIWDMFSPVEGENTVYYGKIRNGKTFAATSDIFEKLAQGEIVYANWKIDFKGFDERQWLGVVFYKWLTGKKYFFNYSPENFHYIDPDELISGKGEINIDYLNRLVNVHLYLDEGQWIIPSHDRSWDSDTIAKMKLVLHGGHYCRSLNIITQRPTNINKTARSQINVWYRCVKAWSAFGFILFKRYTIEEMKDDLPVEFEKLPPRVDSWFWTSDERYIPLGDLKKYWVNVFTNPVMASYDTHGMRGLDAIESLALFDVYATTRWDSFKLLCSLLYKRTLGRRKAAKSGLGGPVRGDSEGNVPLPLKDVLGRHIEAKTPKYIEINNIKSI